MSPFTVSSMWCGRNGTWSVAVLFLAAALMIPACNDSGTGASNPGTTAALWNSVSGSGATGNDPTPGVLLWNDPNTAPIQGGTGTVGNLSYNQADPTDYSASSPLANHPLATGTPMDSAQEQNLEAFALAYNNMLAAQANLGGGGLGGGVGGVAGIGGIGGVGGLNQVPPLYSDRKMELEPRAYCKHLTLLPPVPLSGPGTSLDWRLGQCGVNPAEQNSWESVVPASVTVMDAASAWNAMSGPAQARIQAIAGAGYCGAGYWSANGVTNWKLDIIDLPLGQVP